MASFPAAGDGPIAFFDGVTGQQLIVPLSSVQFTNAAGTAVELLPPFDSSPHAAALKDWILYLVSAGRLTVGAGPPLKLAFVATAVDKGSAGDNIAITVAHSNPTTFDVTAAESEVYTGLTIASIKGILGTGTTPGSKPGLVHVVDGPIAMPLATSSPQPLGGGSSSAASTFPVPASSGTAFTLEARRVGTEGDSITVSISDVDTAAGTFSLQVDWTDSVTGVVAADLPTLDTKLAPLGFLVAITAPTGGFAMPQDTSLTLGGGVDPIAAAQSFAASS